MQRRSKKARRKRRLGLALRATGGGLLLGSATKDLVDLKRKRDPSKSEDWINSGVLATGTGLGALGLSMTRRKKRKRRRRIGVR